MTPNIVDIVWFLFPTTWSGRDTVYSVYYIPLIFILTSGIQLLIIKNYFVELGKLVFLPLVLFTITALVWVMTASFIGLLGLVSGMATGLVISLVWILYEKRGRKLLFGKESAEIKRLKDNLKQLYRKSSAQFEKEKKDLIGRITSELGHFELAFEHITKNTNSDLRSLEAEHSFGLISDKDYVKKEKRLKQLYINAKTLLSTIQS